MSLNVGGIYIEATKVTDVEVIAVIEEYWTRLGATKSTLDPLAMAPLALSKTGQLGFAVSRPLLADADRGRWIAVYDSERYTADPALAETLSATLGVEVWFFEIAGSTDHAYAKRHGARKKVLHDEGEIEDVITPLPHAMLYFNQLRGSPDVLRDFSLLAFDGIPYRAKAKYSGPSDEMRSAQGRAAQAAVFVATRDLAGLRGLATNNDPDVHAVVANELRRIDQRDPAGLAFVYGVADLVLARDRNNNFVAEACARTGDATRLDKALSGLPDYAAAIATHHASELMRGGEHAVAFAMLEQITRNASAAPVAFSNALHAYSAAVSPPSLDPARLDTLFARSFEVGPASPPSFHNLACALVRAGRLDDALRACALAVKWGYEHVDLMRADDDLAPLRLLPGWEAAFAPPETVSLDDLVVHSTSRRGGERIVTIAPVVLLSLAIGKRKAALAPIADLLNRIASELPRDAFAHYMWGGGMCHWAPIKKGKLARDMSMLRKPQTYRTLLRWGTRGGEPVGYRVSLELEDDKGELSIMLPREQANDPEALATRLGSWAAQIPFVAGIAGYALGIYEEGHVVGPGSYAHDEIGTMRSRYLGLGASPREAELRLWEEGRVPVPGWLTFLSSPLVKAVGGETALARAVSPARVTTLRNGLCIRAADAPFVGVATAPTDLGALPAVARALRSARIDEESEVKRWDTIEAIAIPAGLSVPSIVLATQVPSTGTAGKKPAAKKSAAKNSAAKRLAAKRVAGKRRTIAGA